ncbi:hypothetical protein D3C71_1788080 [compost metagenome]
MGSKASSSTRVSPAAGNVSNTFARAGLCSPCLSSTATTARLPAAFLCTKCATMGKGMPPTFSSLGVWKWNCNSAYSASPISMLPDAGRFTCTVCPLFTTSAGPAR